MQKDYEHTMPYDDGWKTKRGSLRFRMCNDYLFRAFLQRDEDSLRALIASFLRITPDAVGEITVTNPIVLGDDVSDKELHLDVRVITETGQLINFEMQLAKHPGWIERSMLYAFRCFDSTGHGDHYDQIPGVWQISFCNFVLFKKHPSFYSDYMLINTKDINHIYSDKLRIINVDLTNIHLATDEDDRSGIKKWAQLFKAQTWEELIMLAEKDKTIDKAVSSIWQLSEDERIYDQIRRREENERLWNAMVRDAENAKKVMEEADKIKEEAKKIREKAKKDSEKAKKDSEKAKKDSEKAKKDIKKAEMQMAAAEKQMAAAEKKADEAEEQTKKVRKQNEDLQTQLKEKDAIINELKKKLDSTGE